MRSAAHRVPSGFGLWRPCASPSPAPRLSGILQLLCFPRQRGGSEPEEEPAPLSGCWSLGWVFGRREFASWARLGFLYSLNLEGASLPWRFSPGEIGLGFLVRGSG